VIHREEKEQAVVVKWAALQGRTVPGLHRGFAIPNGAFLAGSPQKRAAQWARLVAAGARKGVPDLFWPVPRGGYHGIFIEMKASRPHAAAVTQEQRDEIEAARADGYRAEVCRGADEAIAVLREYFGVVGDDAAPF
jgi:hypothetical protein